jgi:serine protease Do
VTAVKVGDTVPIEVYRNSKLSEASEEGGKAGSEKSGTKGNLLTLQIKVTQRPSVGPLGANDVPEKKKPKKPAKVDVGMTVNDITPEIARELDLPSKTAGVVVSHVNYGGPADRAGLMRGDLILEVSRQSVKDVESFYSLVKEKKSYLLRVRRADTQGRELFEIIILDLK